MGRQEMTLESLQCIWERPREIKAALVFITSLKRVQSRLGGKCELRWSPEALHLPGPMAKKAQEGCWGTSTGGIVQTFQPIMPTGKTKSQLEASRAS